MHSKSAGMIYLGLIIIILIGMVCSKQTFAASGLSIINHALSIPVDVDLNAHSPWITYGQENGDDLGFSVSTAGDVNGDGFDDIIIGAPLYGADREGTAFVYHGTAQGLDSTPDWTMAGGVKGVRFGNAVSGAGDVNGDGYDDVLIGAENYKVDFGEPGTPPSGAVFVYLGSETGLSDSPAWSVLAEVKEISLGHAVSGAGDVNGDGYDDVIVGAPYFESDTEFEGAAFVFYGNGDPSGLETSPDWFIQGDQENGELGSSVAGAGDVNGDEYDDVIVGAKNYPYEGDLNFGAAFLYYGSPDGLNLTHEWESYGSEAYSMYGASVQGAGDVDQDGYADVIIGAYLFGTNGGLNQPDEGAAYLYKGSLSGLEFTPDWTSTGSKAEAWFGFSVGAAGDVNGDGGSDVIIGAPDYKFDSKTVVGSALVYFTETLDPEHQVFLPLLFVQDGE